MNFALALWVIGVIILKIDTSLSILFFGCAGLTALREIWLAILDNTEAIKKNEQTEDPKTG